jgi:UDP:flavonoid glycosyltransferase YjiC (YdhE family)
LPLLLGPRENRPAIAHLGITVLNVHSGTYLPLHLDATPEAASREKDRHSRIVLQPLQAAFDRALSEMDLGPLPHPALESLSRLPDFYIHPGIRSFAFPDDSADVHYIGRLPMAKGQVAMPSWWASLDRSKRLVLVTQGTVANRDFTRLIGPALTGLASQDDVTLLVTTGGQPASSIPVDIPENAFVAEFLPFEEILPHVDLLITNGGYGTVNMALAHGVPIISGGLTEDKEVVSALVQRVGVGIDLRTERPDPDTVRRAVREIFGDPGYLARAQAMAREFESCDAEENLLALLSRMPGR